MKRKNKIMRDSPLNVLKVNFPRAEIEEYFLYEYQESKQINATMITAIIAGMLFCNP